jgi:hypothetical protein
MTPTAKYWDDKYRTFALERNGKSREAGAPLGQAWERAGPKTLAVKEFSSSPARISRFIVQRKPSGRVNLAAAASVYLGMTITMFRVIIASLAALAIAAPTYARDFSGFYTPDLVSGRTPPYVPVSTTASLQLERDVSGQVRFREIGSFRAAGSRSGSAVELSLRDRDGALVGRAHGTISGGRLDLDLELFDRDGPVRSRGRLSLDAVAEWRSSAVTKQKNLRDRGKRFWYDPDFDDSDWEETELPIQSLRTKISNRHSLMRLSVWTMRSSNCLGRCEAAARSGIARRAVDTVRSREIDAVHVSELGMAFADGFSIAERTHQDRRVGCDSGRRFPHLMGVSNQPSSSVIRIRVEGLRLESLAELLIDVMFRAGTALESGGTVTVQPSRVRTRRLPLGGSEVPIPTPSDP